MKLNLKKPLKLTVIAPCYNESRTLDESLKRLTKIAQKNLTLEIIVVNDASVDDSLEKLKALEKKTTSINVFSHKKNKGKGAALQTGFKQASGDIVAIHDLDLEYNPKDLLRLLSVMIEHDADVVYGSRFLTGQERRVHGFVHANANKFLTFFSNLFTNLNLTDMETCYKMVRGDILKKLALKENGFGIEPELTAKLAKFKKNGRRLRFYEIGISYDGRGVEEGKKIRIKDGFHALYCIIKYNLTSH